MIRAIPTHYSLCSFTYPSQVCFQEGSKYNLHSIYTVTSFVVNCSFSNIDLQVEKTYPRIQNAEEKDEYGNDLVKSFKSTGKLSQLWHFLQLS